MSTSWKKVKNLFWQSPDGPSAAAPPPGTEVQEISEAEFAQLLDTGAGAAAESAPDRVDPSTVSVASAGGAVTIDFQAQYDLAGIPDTDEVEQLEGFLTRLDPSLPQVSRIAAAQAFLGAIGKDADAVLADAARKISRVRGIASSKEQETQAALAQEQAQIDQLQAQVEQHRARMQELNRELEGVRQACLGEESRLQAARVFFGNVSPAAGAGAPRR